jgi:hypothetical protein
MIAVHNFDLFGRPITLDPAGAGVGMFYAFVGDEPMGAVQRSIIGGVTFYRAYDFTTGERPLGPLRQSPHAALGDVLIAYYENAPSK